MLDLASGILDIESGIALAELAAGGLATDSLLV